MEDSKDRFGVNYIISQDPQLCNFLCGKPLTVRVVARSTHSGGSSDPVIVHGLISRNDDTVALPS